MLPLAPHLAFYPELHSTQNLWIVFLVLFWLLFLKIIYSNSQGNLKCIEYENLKKKQNSIAFPFFF